MISPSGFGGGSYIFLKMTTVEQVGNPDAKDDVSKLAAKNKWMIVNSCHFGARRDNSTATAGTLSGRASYYDVPFSKDSCRATARLIELCTDGTNVAKAEFFFYADDPSSTTARVDKPIMRLTLSDVKVIAADVGSDPTDSFSLLFSKFEWEIFGQHAADKVG